MQLDQIYRPLTAHPFSLQALTQEYPPCAALRPYVRCFWGSAAPGGAEQPTLVTPDTCADVIFRVDHGTGAVSASFCGVGDQPFLSQPNPAGATGDAGRYSLFAIRFYAWTAALFAQQGMQETQNGSFAAEQYFPQLCRALAPQLPYLPGIASRIRAAETFLLSRLGALRPSPALEQAVGALVLAHGNLRATKLADEVFLSPRQLQRLFAEQVGVSPKTLARLIRYQCLWRDVMAPRFDVQDAVYRYGFTDQAHLQRAFKQCHTMTPQQARRQVLDERAKYVAFLQSRSLAVR